MLRIFIICLDPAIDPCYFSSLVERKRLKNQKKNEKKFLAYLGPPGERQPTYERKKKKLVGRKQCPPHRVIAVLLLPFFFGNNPERSIS
jgi:hypothetical protein